MIKTNIPFVTSQITAYQVKLAHSVKAARDEMSLTLTTIIKNEIKSKRAYTGRGASKKYEKVENGAPPHKRTGTLFRAIKGRKWNKGTEVYGARVGVARNKGAYYGVILESGAVNGSWRHAFIAPAFREFEPLVNPIIAKHIGRVVP